MQRTRTNFKRLKLSGKWLRTEFQNWTHETLLCKQLPDQCPIGAPGQPDMCPVCCQWPQEYSLFVEYSNSMPYFVECICLLPDRVGIPSTANLRDRLPLLAISPLAEPHDWILEQLSIELSVDIMDCVQKLILDADHFVLNYNYKFLEDQDLISARILETALPSLELFDVEIPQVLYPKLQESEPASIHNMQSATYQRRQFFNSHRFFQSEAMLEPMLLPTLSDVNMIPRPELEFLPVNTADMPNTENEICWREGLNVFSGEMLKGIVILHSPKVTHPGAVQPAFDASRYF